LLNLSLNGSADRLLDGSLSGLLIEPADKLTDSILSWACYGLLNGLKGLLAGWLAVCHPLTSVKRR
jgi:hypothetical protein